MALKLPFPELPVHLKAKFDYIILYQENEELKRGHMGVVYKAHRMNYKFSLPLIELAEGTLAANIIEQFHAHNIPILENAEILVQYVKIMQG